MGIKFSVHSDKFTAVTRGRTVKIIDKESGLETARFKELKHAYRASFNPAKPMLAVKSTKFWIAFYSMETMSLICKARIKMPNGKMNKTVQDSGFCFSEDGKYFLNLETVNFSTHLVVYDCETFEETERYFAEDSYRFNVIERHDNGYLLAAFTKFIGGAIWFFDGKTLKKVRNLKASEDIDAYCDIHY